VAIGDKIGGMFGAAAAVLIGERPGAQRRRLARVYVTCRPPPCTVEAARNCLSNIRPPDCPSLKPPSVSAACAARPTAASLWGQARGRGLSSDCLERICLE
jgi:ethanolamine ammonia-lyase small subunit